MKREERESEINDRSTNFVYESGYYIYSACVSVALCCARSRVGMKAQKMISSSGCERIFSKAYILRFSVQCARECVHMCVVNLFLC